MAITAVGTPTTATSATGSLTYSHTVDGSADHVIVCIATRNSTAAPSTVTLGGVAMTLLHSYDADREIFWYGIDAPAAGSHSIVITGTGSDRVRATASDWSGMTGLTVQSSGTGAAVGTSLSVTTSVGTPGDGAVALSAVAENAAAVLSSTSGDTTLGTSSVTALSHYCGYRLLSSPGSTITSSFSSTVSNNLSGSVITIAPAAGGVAIGVATETDSAVAIVASVASPVATATETDIALALAIRTSIPVGVATETSFAPGFATTIATSLGVATETSSALVLSSPGGLQPALETDSALGLGASIADAIGVASETASAIGLASSIADLIGVATETASAIGLGAVVSIGISPALETDSALELPRPGALTPAVETNFALAFGAVVTASLGLATESDVALTLGQASLLGLATETNSALAFGATVFTTIGVASDVSTAIPLTSPGQVFPIAVDLLQFGRVDANLIFGAP